MNIAFNAQSIQKACDLISGDMNIFLSQPQMVELLSANPALFEVVNDGGLSGLFSPAKNNVLMIDFNNPENYLAGRAPDIASHSGVTSFVQKLIFNHFAFSLISKPMPTDDEMDELEDGMFDALFQELLNAAMAKGYKYSSHPNGPDGDTE